MPTNARTRQYVAATDAEWVTIGGESNTRRVFFMQVGADSSPVYIHVGGAVPSILDSILLSALDVMDLERADVIGPIRFKPVTNGSGRVVALEG